MLALDPNFRDLLNFFNLRNVRYLMIGGYAVNYHGHHRNTKDIDLWIESEPQNAKRVAEALINFGFASESVPFEKFLTVNRVFAFGREPFRVDIFTEVPGVDFAACYERRIEGSIDGLRIPVISLADLIANKNASGRLRDKADVEELGG